MTDRDVFFLNAQQAREVPGFDVRTILDDVMGKLMYVRNRIAFDVPDGLIGLLHDAEGLAERAVDLIEDLPEVQMARTPNGFRGDISAPSASSCAYECSCGMFSIDEPK